MRMNISVPDDLAHKSRELALPVSKICQAALAAAAAEATHDGSYGEASLRAALGKIEADVAQMKAILGPVKPKGSRDW
ncbi:type II toxin-antitoxin system CcdA family antitoxin [Streptomyces sp.]|uniref:type II toxin-antitoxin system CcdA family antitoxin n=1 Tax=Streptomyces sp. TaxID=1931 RepID=UPI002F924309